MINQGSPPNGGALYGDEGSGDPGGVTPIEPGGKLPDDPVGEKLPDVGGNPELPAIDPIEEPSKTISWGVLILFACAGLSIWYFFLRD